MSTGLSGSECKAAARRLAKTVEEQKAFRKLLRRETTVDAAKLTKLAAAGVATPYDARSNLNDITNQQLAAGLGLALALSKNTRRLTEFYDNPFWDHKKPNRNKLVLTCLQFAMPPRNVKEQKLLSKFAATVSWVVLQGHGPDDLAQGIAQQGGRSACVKKFAAWRRERREASANQGDPTARKENRRDRA